MPRGPGVYLFRDAAEHVLYVGKASDLRARVRSYFSVRPPRRPVEHALAATERIETRPLGSELEAALVELELILRLRPAANSRNAHPERACYLTLTHADPVPRLAVTDRPQPARHASARCRPAAGAQAAAAALRSAFGIRSCRPAVPEDEERSCLAGLLGRCAAPCRGGADAERHAAAVGRLRGGWRRGARATELRACGCGWRRWGGAPVRGGRRAARPAGGAWTRAPRDGPAAAARARSGVLLAPDLDDRFVQAFACARGRVVGRRRVPRGRRRRGSRSQPLVARAGGGAGRAPPCRSSREQAERRGWSRAAFARPGVDMRAVPVTERRLAGRVR